MSIKIYPDTKIYVTNYANYASGGTELLHQLIFHLRNNLKSNAYLYPLPPNSSNPIHSEYKQYMNPYVREVEDKKRNIIVLFEGIESLKIASNYHKIRKIIWWLSVDNFYLSYIFSSKSNFFIQRALNKIYKKFTGKRLFDINEIVLKDKKFERLQLPDFVKKANYHLAQSHYAMNHLKNIGIPEDKVFYLSDYLNENFLKIQTDLSKKENIVAYNPKKGFSFTKKIIKKSPDTKFVPLINMTRQQVIETLQKTKVYIDFGYHPGKDRIPREAAILGCCVITGKRGSAAFYEDVSIPDEYKFEDKKENIPKIIEKIKDCFESFEERYKDFDNYREKIKSEPQKFLEDLRKIFLKV